MIRILPKSFQSSDQQIALQTPIINQKSLLQWNHFCLSPSVWRKPMSFFLSHLEPKANYDTFMLWFFFPLIIDQSVQQWAIFSPLEPCSAFICSLRAELSCAHQFNEARELFHRGWSIIKGFYCVKALNSICNRNWATNKRFFFLEIKFKEQLSPSSNFMFKKKILYKFTTANNFRVHYIECIVL